VHFSVLITSHNTGAFIGAAIDSALEQTLAPRQVVVVDDGSTDGSQSIIESYGEQITAIFKTQGGQQSAQNAGFGFCTGEAVALLDGDDRFLPDKLARVSGALQANPTAGACFHSRSVYPPDSLPHGELEMTQQGLLDFRRRGRHARMPRVITTPCGMIIRRPVLDTILPLPEDPRLKADDHIMKWAVMSVTPVIFLREVLALQTIHDANFSAADGDPGQYGLLTLLRARMVRQRYPQLRWWADRLYADGVATYRRSTGGDHDPTVSRLVSDYLAPLSPVHRTSLALASAAFAAEYRFKRAVSRRAE
jgi:glycosyltransferase involved in cell wall biosynthesis